MPTQSTSWAGIAVLEASTKSEGNRYCVNKYYRRERDVDVNINPPTRIHIIDRVIFTIKVPVQRQRAIDIPQPLVRARPPAYCRLVVARPRATTPHRRHRGSPMPPQSDRGWHCCPTAPPRCRRLRLSTYWLSPERRSPSPAWYPVHPRAQPPRCGQPERCRNCRHQ